MNKLFQIFNLASQQFQLGLISQSVLIQWLRASHVIPETYSLNIIGIHITSLFPSLFHILLLTEGVLSGILARNIDANLYKLGTDTFEWNGFMDCIQTLATEIHLPLNDFVKKLLMADEFAFQRWQAETEYIPEVGTNKKINRLWDAKKVESVAFAISKRFSFDYNEKRFLPLLISCVM
jgi:hypothetical protein